MIAGFQRSVTWLRWSFALTHVSGRGCARCHPDTGWKTFYRFANVFSCKLVAIGCFEFEDPRTVFNLVLVVEHRIVGFSIHPHSIDNFEPTLS